MKIQQLTVEEALRSLHTRAEGLSSAEAARRLREFGPNRIERVRRTLPFWRFLRGLTHLFAIVLWIAAALALVAEANDPGKGMGTLGLAIIGVILINAAFSFWQEYRAEKAILALERLLPKKVKAIRDGRLQELDAADLVPGDVLVLTEGDDIPADCRLIEAFGARVNNASVTGESVPVARDERPSAAAELIHSRSIVLAGTSLVSGEAKAVVFATGMHTEFGRIAHLTQAGGTVVTPLQREITHVSRLVAILATGLGLTFFAIGQLLGLSFWDNFIFAVGIIVANVPEGLLPTVTLALAMGAQRMAAKNALIRHLPSVETLGSATVICTDKTGTLTQNRMEVKALFLGEGFREPGDLVHVEARPLLEAALFCHGLKETAVEGTKHLLGDPMEVALVRMAERALGESPGYPRVDELPFETERRMASTLHRGSEGLMLYSKGALEALLPHCQMAQLGAQVRPLTPALAQTFLDAEQALADQGLRVLALAYRPVSEPYQREHLEEALILLGLVGLEDPPRPEVPAAIARCRQAGIKIIMITGDHPRTALALAREVGLVRGAEPVVITGERLKHLSKAQLRLALDAPEILFARVGPDQKLSIVSTLQEKKAVVAVTGDGVNDAPALKQADIGIAMGIAGTDVAREAADIVLLDDNFASIVAAVEEGRAVFQNIRKFLTYILTSNVPEIVPYLAFVLFNIPLPLTVIQILAVDLGTDMLPALALGAERPDPDLMRRSPRPRHERLLRWPLLARAYLFLGPIEALAAMAAFFFVLMAGGWTYGMPLAFTSALYLQATTACLSAIIVMQAVNVFLCRSERDSVFSRGLFDNRLILLGIVVEFAMILWIDYTSWGNRLFGTAPIGPEVWLLTLPFAFAMLVLEESRKRLVRRSPVGKP